MFQPDRIKPVGEDNLVTSWKFLANRSIGKIYALFRYRKKALTYLHVQQLYSSHAYIAFRENSHVSVEAQLILNKF